jgi:RimJ/RimL family protein N-acetyltransferase
MAGALVTERLALRGWHAADADAALGAYGDAEVARWLTPETDRVEKWAFGQGIEQIIALVRPANRGAVATVRRIGMEWVGEPDKYHRLPAAIPAAPRDLADLA